MRRSMRDFIRSSLAITCLLCQFPGYASPMAAASDTAPTIVGVEEDWEMVAGQADPNSIAPQVTCVISPTGDVNSLYAAFEVNHQSQPVFVGGGLQLQIWNHENPLATHKFPQANLMSQGEETVRWTQTMSLAEGKLKFEVVQGSSTTWGEFGGQGFLTTQFTTDIATLNGYSPQVSAANSGIGYAANRVKSLILKRVRLITSTGDVLENTTARVVHQKD